MSAPVLLQLNDIGTHLRVLVTEGGLPLDISAASTKEILLKAKDGPLKTFQADFDTDGTDGLLVHVTLTGDLDAVGEWRVQGHVVLAPGDWHTHPGRFEVFDNLT